MECLIDGCWGIYIPQRFAEECDTASWGINPQDAEVLMAGPDHPDYWDVWDAVLSTASFTDEDGTKWSLYQDGDLFAVSELEEIEL